MSKANSNSTQSKTLTKNNYYNDSVKKVLICGDCSSGEEEETNNNGKRSSEAVMKDFAFKRSLMDVWV